jgi:hypothetical protein
VVRLDVLKKFPFNNFKNYFARDWTIIMFLLGQGQINRDRISRAYFGSKGLSFKPHTLKIQRFSDKKYNCASQVASGESNLAIIFSRAFFKGAHE